MQEIESKMICDHCKKDAFETIEVKTKSENGEILKVDMCLACIVEQGREILKTRKDLQDTDPMK